MPTIDPGLFGIELVDFNPPDFAGLNASKEKVIISEVLSTYAYC